MRFQRYVDSFRPKEGYYIVQTHFLSPPGPVARIVDGAFVCLAGAAAVFVYGIIAFHLCADSACDGLRYFRLWALHPIIFLIFGLSALVTGVYLMVDRQGGRLFRYAIAFGVLSGFIILAPIAFGIGMELASAA